MLDHVLVPLDGSSLAECALPHVLTLARVFGSRVTLLQVMEPTLMHRSIETIDPLDWQLSKSEAGAYLDSVLARLEAAGVTATAALLEGRAAERIVEYIHSEHIDLIALSSHGQSGLNEWSMGSMAHKILMRACSSQLIVRAQSPMMDLSAAHRYQRIFVPLDLSWRAECALPLAAALAQGCGAELVVAHVVCKPEMARRMPLAEVDISLAARVEERNREEAERYFEQLRFRLPESAAAHVISGDNVTAALLDLAERLQSDLVVLSAHGHTGQARRPFGRVTHSFISYGSAPVLMVQDASSGSTIPKEKMPTPHRQAGVQLHG